MVQYKNLKADPTLAETPLAFSSVSHAYPAVGAQRAIAAGGHYNGVMNALSDFSLTLGKGEIVCLLGPSGSGKSTALRLAAGLERLQKGKVLLRGRVASAKHTHWSPEHRDMGMVFQDFALFPHMSAWQNVAFGLRGIASEKRRQIAHDWIDRVGLGGKADHLPHELSGGQQQRVGLARALAPQPGVLLLDEPYSGLDQSLRERLRDDTMHFIRSIGASALMVTHDPDEAMYMANRIAVIRDGQLLQNDVPDEVLFHPKDPFVVAIFGEPNRVKGRVTNGVVDTPLGRFEAAQFAEGAELDVLIPPHGIKPCPVGRLQADDEPWANAANGAALPIGQVMESRLLGRNSLVHMSLETGGSEPLHVHSKVDGIFLPENGLSLGLGVSRDLVFMFESK